MIELLVLVIQFIAEVVAQALISIPFDLTTYRKKEQPASILGVGFVLLLLGGCTGGLLAGFIPQLVHSPLLRIANLVISPMLAGEMGYRIAKWRFENLDPAVIPKHHYWYAFLFTLGFVCIRFAYAK